MGRSQAPQRSSTTGRNRLRPRRRRGSIAIKRVYDPALDSDGIRVMVDRLWPRGLSKAKLQCDAWPHELAPSDELRKWYGHKPERFAEFRRRYRAELAAQSDAVATLRASIKGRAATLLTATRDLDLSQAAVLREVLLGRRT